jgi:hypothetical protein
VWLPNLSKMGEHNRSIALFNRTLNVLAYVPALATLGSELPRTPSPRSSHSGDSPKFKFVSNGVLGSWPRIHRGFIGSC